MLKPTNIIDKYNTVLFDMDGVITSEQRYWDCSALTIYQYLNDGINPSKAMEQRQEISQTVFADDKILMYLKDKGINSNWDVTYLVLSIALMLDVKDDFQPVYTYLQQLNKEAFELYSYFGEKGPLGKRGSTVYHRLVLTFQEWYLGDKLFEQYWHEKPRLKGKKGLIWFEEPVVPISNIKKVLNYLKDSGLSIGIGTGRVDFEAANPLKIFKIEKYFDNNRIITYTDIINAEKNTGVKPLAKPHPYTFLKGMLGRQYSDTDIINANYDKSNTSKTLVVGDAGADLMSAQAAGMDFAAVLTGISGDKSKDYFINNGATYIFNDIYGFLEGIDLQNNGKNNSYCAVDKRMRTQAQSRR
ncbi:MAG: HAD hydrolase-like protein [Clostridiaceae bacterium]|nr:HAD hydrolase-like protein [Clostridiaceae bacterium]